MRTPPRFKRFILIVLGVIILLIIMLLDIPIVAESFEVG